MTHKHVYSLNERNLNTRTERKNYVHGVKRKETKKREKWEKGENTNNRCFMIIKCNLNKVVVYKNVYACVYLCLCNMHVRSSVSKCSVCENTGGLIHIIQT